MATDFIKETTIKINEMKALVSEWTKSRDELTGQIKVHKQALSDLGIKTPKEAKERIKTLESAIAEQKKILTDKLKSIEEQLEDIDNV